MPHLRKVQISLVIVVGILFAASRGHVKSPTLFAMVTLLLPLTARAGTVKTPSRAAGHGNQLSATFKRFTKPAQGNSSAPRPKPGREYRANDPEKRRAGLLRRVLGRGASGPNEGGANSGRSRASETARQYRANDPEIQRTARQLGVEPEVLAESMEELSKAIHKILRANDGKP